MKRTESSYQLSLFRDYKPNDENAFVEAEAAKKAVMEKANAVYNQEIDKADNSINFESVRFTTKITQVREEESMEPDTVRIFIRKVKTSATFSDGAEIANLEKVIPEWANSIYIDDYFSMEQFLEICCRIFAFENAREWLKDREIVSRIKTQAKDKQVILYFDRKMLQSSQFSDTESIHVRMALNRINNAYEDVKSIASDNGWIICGAYEDFTEDRSFVAELAITSNFGKYRTDKLFVTDYLFINNAEFLSQKYNTTGWPLVLYTDAVLEKASLPLETYFYAKAMPDAKFYRFEIYRSTIQDSEICQIIKYLQNGM